MAHTFDIRFARSSGLAAFLQAPTNTFRWKGAGRLSIDPEGISIAVRRGVPALFPHTRRVPAADLKGVLREGEALRVEFSTDNNSRAVVLFWVRDQETAEEIVRLLPTTRTVELNHDAAGVAQARVGIDWRALSLLAVALVAVVGSAWMLQRSDVPAPVIQADAQVATPESGASAAPSGGSSQTVEVPNPADQSAIAAPPNVRQETRRMPPALTFPWSSLRRILMRPPRRRQSPCKLSQRRALQPLMRTHSRELRDARKRRKAWCPSCRECRRTPRRAGNSICSCPKPRNFTATAALMRAGGK